MISIPKRYSAFNSAAVLTGILSARADRFQALQKPRPPFSNVLKRNLIAPQHNLRRPRAAPHRELDCDLIAPQLCSCGPPQSTDLRKGRQSTDIQAKMKKAAHRRPFLSPSKSEV
jgi:hypothetical protein